MHRLSLSAHPVWIHVVEQVEIGRIRLRYIYCDNLNYYSTPDPYYEFSHSARCGSGLEIAKGYLLLRVFKKYM